MYVSGVAMRSWPFSNVVSRFLVSWPKTTESSRWRRHSPHGPLTETGPGVRDSPVFRELNADASSAAISLEVGKLVIYPPKRQGLAVCHANGNPVSRPLPMTWPLSPEKTWIAIEAYARRFDVYCDWIARPDILVEVQFCTLVVPLKFV